MCCGEKPSGTGSKRQISLRLSSPPAPTPKTATEQQPVSGSARFGAKSQRPLGWNAISAQCETAAKSFAASTAQFGPRAMRGVVVVVVVVAAVRVWCVCGACVVRVWCCLTLGTVDSVSTCVRRPVLVSMR